MANKWFETVAVAQRRAKRRLPKSVYGALIAGAEAGVTIRDNVDAFAELGLAPHVAVLNAPRKMATTVPRTNTALPAKSARRMEHFQILSGNLVLISGNERLSDERGPGRITKVQ